MRVVKWTGIMIAALALGCASGRSQTRTAAAQPRDTTGGGGANATASNAEAASQRPSQGAGGQDPHPAVTNPSDPRYAGKNDANSGTVERPGLEGRPGLPTADAQASNGTGSASASGAAGAAAAKSDVKELPEITGQVSRVSTDDITIKPSSGDAVTLKVDQQTAVDGQPGRVSTMLHEGDQVRASYDEQKGDKIAVDVRRSGASSSTGTSTGTESRTSAGQTTDTAPTTK